MKRSLWMTLAASALLALGLQSPVALAQNSQQAKMTSCNADAKTKNLTGDDRKAFMQKCLSASGGSTSTHSNSQQEKMKSCSADAKTKGLKGDDRQKFMSDCLKGSS